MVKILAIESSCDETAAAVVSDGNSILSNIIASQIPVHRLYGGVVPEIASRHHLEAIVPVVGEALSAAGCEFCMLSISNTIWLIPIWLWWFPVAIAVCC